MTRLLSLRLKKYSNLCLMPENNKTAKIRSINQTLNHLLTKKTLSIFHLTITNIPKTPSKKVDLTFPDTALTCYPKVYLIWAKNDHYFFFILPFIC